MFYQLWQFEEYDKALLFWPKSLTPNGIVPISQACPLDGLDELGYVRLGYAVLSSRLGLGLSVGY